jgi:hypothetical protein
MSVLVLDIGAPDLVEVLVKLEHLSLEIPNAVTASALQGLLLLA